MFPASIPSPIVRMAEKWIKSVATETNNPVKRSVSPTDHHSSYVWGVSKKRLEADFICTSKLIIARRESEYKQSATTYVMEMYIDL